MQACSLYTFAYIQNHTHTGAHVDFFFCSGFIIPIINCLIFLSLLVRLLKSLFILNIWVFQIGLQIKHTTAKILPQRFYKISCTLHTLTYYVTLLRVDTIHLGSFDTNIQIYIYIYVYQFVFSILIKLIPFFP